QGCQDLMRKEQELVRVELLGLAAVALAQELLELVLELLDQMVLEAQRLDELADQLVGRVQIGGEFAPGGRHTLEYGNDRREQQEILNETCEFVSCFCGPCRREGKAALPARVLQVDPLEDGGHLGGRDLDAIALGRWEPEDSTLQSLRPNDVAVAVPMEDL